MSYKVCALIIFTIGVAYSTFLNIISYLSKNNPLPENVKDVYDPETYAKWKAYHTETNRVAIVSPIVTYLIYLPLLIFNVHAMVASPLSGNLYLSAVGVMVFTLTVDLIVDSVFSYIYSMKIDEKYGFNKRTIKTFISDQIKTYLTSLIVLCLLVCLFIAIYESMGDWCLVLFTAIAVVLLFAVVFLYPYFSKIYNKFTPLEDGELREKLTSLLEKNGYSVKEIQVMDASRRTTKSNAYFSGYGKTKTIVLYDTMLASMTPDEITAVFAHELGHGLHKDTTKNSFVSILQVVVLVLLAWLTVKCVPVYDAFGFDGRNYGFAFLLVAMAEFPLISPVFSILANYISRKAEFRADLHAVKEGYGEQLIASLKKLSKENLSDLSPSNLVVILTYSHPTLSQRIAAAQKAMKDIKP